MVPKILMATITTILISITDSEDDNSYTWLHTAALISSGVVSVLSGMDSFYDFENKFVNANSTANKLLALATYIRTELALPINKRRDITTLMSYVSNELRNVAEFGRPLPLSFSK